MNIIYVKSPEEAGKKAFDLFNEALEQGAKVLGLATGSSPEPLYKLWRESQLDFSELISVNLDEYVGLSGEHHQSYRYFMNEQVFKTKPFKHSFVPDGSQEDAEKAIADYEEILKQYPVDVQLLGIGRNGHIGFNEPGTSFTQRTHKVKLTQSTIDANKRFFTENEAVPEYAYTMGLANIMEARQIILIACGQSKAEAIKGVVEGELTEDLPASILQNHPNVTLIIDEAAGFLLTNNH